MLQFKKHFILCISFINAYILFAQTVGLQDSLYCNYLGQEKGLLQLNVKDLALDDLGYLWAGTEDGLHKFNSYTFKAYLHNPNDSTTIKDDHVRGLLFTNDTLWNATNTKGIIGFIPSKDQFFDLPVNVNNPDLNTSYDTFLLNNTWLLFAVKNHVILFNRKTKKSQVIKLPKGGSELYVTDIIATHTNRFWLGTSSLGVLSLDLNTFKIKTTGICTNNSDLFFHKEADSIFIGSKEGLYTYHISTAVLQKTPFEKSINCFYKINNDTFFIGTQSGLFRYNTANKSFTRIVCITKENKKFQTMDINKIIGDDNGNMWIGTEADGLLHYNKYQKKFTTLKLALQAYPLKNNISSFQFLKGKDSTLWVGSKFGVVRYSHINQQFKLYENEGQPLIYTLVRDKNNTIWAGGFTTGLLKYDAKLDKFIKVKGNNYKLPNEDVIEIIPVNKNVLWVCTWSGGIHKFDILKEEFEEVLLQGKRIDRARTSLVDSKGAIWLGTDEGAYQIHKDLKSRLFKSEGEPDEKISSPRVFSIQEDHLGHIWVGTNAGLTKINTVTNKTTLYYKQKGLPNDFIYAILVADKNDIWVSTNYGISQLNTKTNTFTNYTVSDGLQNNEFNGKAGYKDHFGNLYFGGITGFNIFHPNHLKLNPHVPNIQIESIDLFNQPIKQNVTYLDNLEFRSDENVLTFNFAAINYPNPEKCVYTYQMEGFDENWRPITTEKSTTYTNLDPGNYIFKVKASNDVGVWNEAPKTLKITIIPPWYQTSWFKIASVLSLLLLMILFYLYKMSKLKKDTIKLEQLVASRTNEIAIKNKDLENAYLEAEKQKHNIAFLMRELSHRVKNNLQIISSLLNIQANNLDEITSKNAIKVAKNRILTISHIEDKIPKENEIIQIDLFIKSISESIISALSDDESLKFKTDFQLEKDIFLKSVNVTLIGLILNELITNTTKYAFETSSPKNILKITCYTLKNELVLTISDNGKGYNMADFETEKSLGIELVTEMVDQLNGKLQINSTKGVENIIKIPL